MEKQDSSLLPPKAAERWELAYAEGYKAATVDVAKAVTHLLNGGSLSDLEIGKHMSLEAVGMLDRISREVTVGGTEDF